MTPHQTAVSIVADHLAGLETDEAEMARHGWIIGDPALVSAAVDELCRHLTAVLNPGPEPVRGCVRPDKHGGDCAAGDGRTWPGPHPGPAIRPEDAAATILGIVLNGTPAGEHSGNLRARAEIEQDTGHPVRERQDILESADDAPSDPDPGLAPTGDPECDDCHEAQRQAGLPACREHREPADDCRLTGARQKLRRIGRIVAEMRDQHLDGYADQLEQLAEGLRSDWNRVTSELVQAQPAAHPGDEPDLDLDAIEARANAATPGPWHDDHEQFEGKELPCVAVGDFGWVCAGQNVPAYDEDSEQGKADAEFIAHARADVPALVARVRQLETSRQLDRRTIDGCKRRITELEQTRDLHADRAAKLTDERDEARAELATARRTAAANLIDRFEAEVRRMGLDPDGPDDALGYVRGLRLLIHLNRTDTTTEETDHA